MNESLFIIKLFPKGRVSTEICRSFYNSKIETSLSVKIRGFEILLWIVRCWMSANSLGTFLWGGAREKNLF